MKKIDWQRILAIVLFLSLAASIVFVSIRLIALPDDPQNQHIRGDYTLMLIQCIAGLIVMFLPMVLKRRFRIVFSDTINALYFLFLYCSVYLGEVHSFYFRIPFWDSILHGFSGAMLGALGFSVINLMSRSGQLTEQLSPIFTCLFAFCFAIAIGVLWEIYEFSFDALMGLNMQKFALEDGTQLIGRAALDDTMKDLIIDAIGALSMTVAGYLAIRRKKAK